MVSFDDYHTLAFLNLSMADDDRHCLWPSRLRMKALDSDFMI